MSLEHNFLRPVDIDEPSQIFFWEFPQALIGISLIVAGILMQSGMGMLLFGFLGSWYLVYAKRQSATSKRGEFLHKLWTLGIRPDKLLKKYPFGIKNFSGKY